MAEYSITDTTRYKTVFEAVNSYFVERRKELQGATRGRTAASSFKSAHKCAHCQKDIIDENTLRSGTLSVRLSYDVDGAVEAARQGCALYIWLLDHLVESHEPVKPPERIRFILVFATDVYSVSRGDVCGARVVIDWQGESGYWHRKNLPLLFVWALPGDPAAESVKTRPVNCDTRSQQAFDFAYRWYKQCYDTHPECRGEAPFGNIGYPDAGRSAPPLRLIDLSTCEEDNLVKVRGIEGRTFLWSSRYAILSYCWGGDQETRLTKERALEYRSGILSTSLPQTIQDAIHDDPQEKAAEIDKMVGYFKEAEVTICAASAKAASEGFLGIMAKIRYAVGPFELQYRCLGGELGSIQLFQEAELEPEPIAARAWTLQETSISRKTLIYSSNQLQWSCLETQVRDGGPSKGRLMAIRDAWPGRTEIPSIQGTHPLPESYSYGCEILHDWHLTVENYMSRRMTQPEDKLPAISGLAQRYKAGFIRAKASFAERREPMYAAGLWTCAMDSSLLWVTVSPAVTRPQKYRAPSWSWAAVDGPISHFLCDAGGTLKRKFYLNSPTDAHDSFIQMASHLFDQQVLFQDYFPRFDVGQAERSWTIMAFGRSRPMPLKVEIADPESFGEYKDTTPEDEEPIVRLDTDVERRWVSGLKHKEKQLWLLEVVPFHVEGSLKGRLPETPKGLVLALDEGNSCFSRVGVFHFDCSLGNERIERIKLRQSFFDGVQPRQITIV
ncbi:hypothetical protein BKA61DRAFT_738750 [Leptodontidium sp. MPI-SDFR-AT-0119]|nr:hypothetical protein BKA61DRAFT_738750 [Leptodontidium sp. MPI-SDFR-AT-0119]